MKSPLTLLILFLISTTVAFGQTPRSEMMKGVKLSEPQPPSATLVIGANELAESISEPGWPIIVSATVLAADGSPGAVPENAALILLDHSRQPVAVVFDALKLADQGTRYWIAPQNATKNLLPGEYMITVQPMAGFSLQPAYLQVVAASPENAPGRDLLAIQQLLLLGKEDEALTEIDRQIAQNVENVDAWVAKGDILMGKDLPDEALKAYDQALQIALKEDPEPLFIEERRTAAFWASLEKRGVVTSPGD